MFLPAFLRLDRPIPAARWSAVAALTLVVALVAVLQQTPYAPLPDRHDSTVAGMAFGMATFATVLRLLHRRRGLVR